MTKKKIIGKKQKKFNKAKLLKIINFYDGVEI